MKFSFNTLGCKVNQYETEALKEIVLSRGFVIDDEKPDVFIINTCTVTAVSDKKNIKTIKKVKKDNPKAIIAVCGCFAQISPEKAINLPEVDVVCGTKDRISVIDMCIDAYSNHTKHSQVLQENLPFEVMPAAIHSKKTRGLLKIQDGCNNFCSYCIIPYARGRSRSMLICDVLEQAEKLAKTGVKEITITGIEISSYGKDTGENLIVLLDKLCETYKNIRFRLGSLEPRTITLEFCETLSKHENLNPHFHLSLQSGSDEILKMMNRKYDTKLYINACDLLRKYFNNPAITTDLIVGFPGEIDALFCETLEFIQKCKFSSMHIFPYSIREGTKAASMDMQIDVNIKNERVQIATKIAKDMENNYLSNFIGKKVEIIVETFSNNLSKGHSQYNFLVYCTDKNLVKGEKIELLITKLENDKLIGEKII